MVDPNQFLMDSKNLDTSLNLDRYLFLMTIHRTPRSQEPFKLNSAFQQLYQKLFAPSWVVTSKGVWVPSKASLPWFGSGVVRGTLRGGGCGGGSDASSWFWRWLRPLGTACPGTPAHLLSHSPQPAGEGENETCSSSSCQWLLVKTFSGTLDNGHRLGPVLWERLSSLFGTEYTY